jgi:hypothetical protein
MGGEITDRAVCSLDRRLFGAGCAHSHQFHINILFSIW